MVVVLSERNLRTLLVKLHDPTMTPLILFPGRAVEPTLVVIAEPDQVHYGRRGYGPGQMHPDTEEALAAWDFAERRSRLRNRDDRG